MQKPDESHRYDALIVGQGLAGSLLAWELKARGRSVLVLDDAAKNAASRVAAGLINPVTGPRLVKTPLADELLPGLTASLSDLERRLGTRFLHRMPLLRRFDSERTQEFWQRRVQDPAYRDYLDQRPRMPEDLAPCDAPLGGFAQEQTGRLDTAALIDRLRDWLGADSSVRDASIDYRDIRVSPQKVRWRNLIADKILFCEGYRLSANPWFDWLPLQPAKGEILTFEARDALQPRILIAGRWLVPIGERRFRFGATYDWNQLDEEPTQASQDRLLADLTAGFPALARSATLHDHRAGVRPGTRDRHPFVGMHPQLPSVGVFNGFGSKGSLTIPWYAQRFADFLTTGAPLPPEADIRRWWQSACDDEAVPDAQNAGKRT